MNDFGIWFIIVWIILFPLAVFETIRRFRRAKAKPDPREPDDVLSPRGRSLVRAARMMGWCLLLVGGILAIGFTVEIIQPGATIEVNGKPRDELWVKTLTILFLVTVPMVGGFMAFCPKERFLRLHTRSQGSINRFNQILKGK